MKKLFLGLKIDSTYASLVFSERPLSDLSQNLNLKLIERKNLNSSGLEEETLQEVREEIFKAEEITSSRVSKIYFCFPQERLRKLKFSYKKLLHPRHSLPLSLSSITSALKEAQLLNLDWEDFCLESYPLEFRVDGKTFRNPPLGIYGRKLEVDVLFYVCRRDDLLNIEKAFQYLGRPYGDLVLSSLAEVSSFREESLGGGSFSLLNIGRNKLEFSYFKNFILEDSFFLEEGGRVIDESISKELGISEKLAEELKLSYASLKREDLEDSSSITVRRADRYKEIQRRLLNSVVFSSYQKILQKLRQVLKEKDLLRKIDYLVLAGGASKIKGLETLTEEVLSLPVKKPPLYVSYPEDTQDRFLASLGVLRFAFSKFNIRNRLKKKEGFFSKIKSFLEEYF